MIVYKNDTHASFQGEIGAKQLCGNFQVPQIAKTRDKYKIKYMTAAISIKRLGVCA